MNEIATIGLDLAKRYFPVHAADATGQELLRRKLRRAEVEPFLAATPACLVAMEACSTVHHWARVAARHGHQVRLLPPQYVKPYVRRNKNDAADAAAICEAASRPSMRFVAVKTVEQQAALTLHRTRALLVKQRSMLANALHGHLGEYGIASTQGIPAMRERAAAILIGEEAGCLPALAMQALKLLARQFIDLDAQVQRAEAMVLAAHKADAASRRLASIPGIGPVTASALVASIGDVGQFRSGRELAAWLGLTPKQNSSGGKDRLGGISKRGDAYLRRLLVNGAMTIIRHAQVAQEKPTSRIACSALGQWVRALLARRKRLPAAVALANKLARIVWAVLTRGEEFRPLGRSPMPA